MLLNKEKKVRKLIFINPQDFVRVDSNAACFIGSICSLPQIEKIVFNLGVINKNDVYGNMKFIKFSEIISQTVGHGSIIFKYKMSRDEFKDDLTKRQFAKFFENFLHLGYFDTIIFQNDLYKNQSCIQFKPFFNVSQDNICDSFAQAAVDCSVSIINHSIKNNVHKIFLNFQQLILGNFKQHNGKYPNECIEIKNLLLRYLCPLIDVTRLLPHNQLLLGVMVAKSIQKLIEANKNSEYLARESRSTVALGVFWLFRLLFQDELIKIARSEDKSTRTYRFANIILNSNYRDELFRKKLPNEIELSLSEYINNKLKVPLLVMQQLLKQQPEHKNLFNCLKALTTILEQISNIKENPNSKTVTKNNVEGNIDNKITSCGKLLF
jgi:hypothetical protein